MNLFTDTRLTALGILHATTPCAMGNMRLPQNTQKLFEQQNIPESHIARFKQIHSDTLVCVSGLSQVQTLLKQPLLEADGWIISGTQIGAAILTADCVPLIIWDESAQVMGLSHCGWRGVAAELPAKTARQMRSCGAQGKLSAWVGPHIQVCCFEVQDDVANQFPNAVQVRGNKKFVDLNQEILRQLTQENIAPQDIVFSKHCTCCEPENFFSFRRDHTKDALLTFVYKP